MSAGALCCRAAGRGLTIGGRFQCRLKFIYDYRPSLIASGGFPIGNSKRRHQPSRRSGREGGPARRGAAYALTLMRRRRPAARVVAVKIP
jgi:hypothetical protein